MTEPSKELWERVEEMLRVKKAADGGKALLSNQGQALDGYSELANYRRVLEEIEKEAK